MMNPITHYALFPEVMRCLASKPHPSLEITLSLASSPSPRRARLSPHPLASAFRNMGALVLISFGLEWVTHDDVLSVHRKGPYPQIGLTQDN